MTNVFSSTVGVLFLERKKSLVKERSWSAWRGLARRHPPVSELASLAIAICSQYVEADELEWLVLRCSMFA
ncbi:hypothetical protein, conserved [Eimeria tenella]|uniref:Uncharacterized protein n=1 Tax=Eimeria tenella TaxID=5802 RepID=U6KIS0_EIMTE|nr:hypothetical protein, conserved [Eimeria tenella]CDJ37910.1 hypothetical protein, conserved [Eimeria tenella]|eukprot:XP_013228748.1 hypothetical protein, conserved [Eimeria tenella]